MSKTGSLRLLVLLLAPAALALGIAGCKREVEPPAPAAAAPGVPPTSMPAGAPTSMPGGAPTSMPAGGPAAALPIDPSKVIAGTIAVSPALAAQVKPGDTIFLSARTAGGAPGPGSILAVQRFTVDKLPVAFELTGANAMIPGIRFEGKATLTARIDRDGDAMTKNPGDLEGTLGPIDIPAKALRVVIDTVRK